MAQARGARRGRPGQPFESQHPQARQAIDEIVLARPRGGRKQRQHALVYLVAGIPDPLPEPAPEVLRRPGDAGETGEETLVERHRRDAIRGAVEQLEGPAGMPRIGCVKREVAVEQGLARRAGAKRRAP